RAGGRHALGLPGQAAFAAKSSPVQDRDDGFLALVRNDGDFHASFLNEVDGLGCVSLREKLLVFPIADDHPARAVRTEEVAWIEGRSGGFFSRLLGCLGQIPPFPARISAALSETVQR